MSDPLSAGERSIMQEISQRRTRAVNEILGAIHSPAVLSTNALEEAARALREGVLVPECGWQPPEGGLGPCNQPKGHLGRHGRIVFEPGSPVVPRGSAPADA